MSLDTVIDDMAKRLETAAAEFGREVETDIRQELSNDFPPSSEDGSPPHKRTGNLAAAMQSRQERSGDTISAVVANTAPYAAHLEHGTEHMAARPFMAPAQEKWSPQWAERAKQAATGRT